MRKWRFRGAILAAAALGALGRGPARAAQPADEPPAPGPAPAPPAPAAAIGGPSTCPRPAAVFDELLTLVPRERLEARLRAIARGKTPVVEIVDLGVPYRIIAAGQVREYRDESRDCAYRARIAAVFVALAIDPAELIAPPAPPPPPAPAPLPAPAMEAPPPVARLDLGATVLGGIGSGDRGADFGAELRWAGGRGRVGPEAGLLALLPVDNTIGGVRLRQWRLPVDAGVRARIVGPRFERYGEIGLAAALLSVRALDLASPRSQTALELGVHIAVGLHATGHRLAPFAALAVELVPDPPAVFALPAGTVGHTPLLWAGATAGASLGFW
ncbi:MAG TPA: hypothetical protein VGP64_16130 [Polyangia bacterium]